MFRLVRYALRQLREKPGFATTAILTLAIGIGAPATMFAVLDAVLLEPLPFAQPDRLVAIASQPDGVISIPTMQDYQKRSSAFESVAAYRSWSPSQKSTSTERARRILIVTQGFFSTLGTRFALGSNWTMTGNEQDCASEAVVSGAYWKRLSGGSVLGDKKLNLDGRDFTVSGVLPLDQPIEGSFALNQPEVFLQVGCDSEEHSAERGNSDFNLIGRLRPKVTVAQASADLARVDAALQREFPNDYGDSRAAFRKPTLVAPYIDLLVGSDSRSALILTFTACALLLLIACANLANLLLARNTRRRAEFAIRATLGATAVQLLKQFLVESAVLVFCGAVGGIAIAQLTLAALKQTTMLQMPRLAHASMRPAVLGFVIVLAAAVTFLLGVLPARRSLRATLLGDLQGVRGTMGRSLRLAGRLLVVAQLTLTLVLLACGGWMVASVYTLLHQPLGFAPEQLLMMQIYVGPDHPTKSDDTRSELELAQMGASLRQLPGIDSAALSDHVPLGHSINRYDFCSDAHPAECKQQVNINPDSYAIGPGYFSTIGQALLAGRDFNGADDGRNHVAIVNQALAQREWPGQSALGRRVHTGEIRIPQGDSWATVIGVVANVHTYDLASAPGPDLYVPRTEDPKGYSWLLLKAKGDPATLKSSARLKLKAEFPTAALGHFETMEEEMTNEVMERVFLMRVAMAFGAVALFLSILGTYGLLAYEVSLRDKEIGIRIALGSSRERIVALLLHQESRWLVGGVLLGLNFAILTGYLLRSRFYGSALNLLPMLGAAALLLAIPAFLAVLIPARRASLQDPAQTLRRE